MSFSDFTKPELLEELDARFLREQQQASAEVPEWAYDKAAELITAEREKSGPHMPANRALARYIAATEPTPVDPVQQLAAQICAKLRGTGSSAAMVKEVEAMIHLSGVTVAKGGE